MDNRLYNRRKELDLTLEQVGEMCGVGKSTVRKWENGIINNMGRDKIVLLANALQVSPLFILQADSSERVLSKFDRKILEICDKLNANGKSEAVKRVEELTQIPSYQEGIHLVSKDISPSSTETFQFAAYGGDGVQTREIPAENRKRALEELEKIKKNLKQ